MFISEDMHLLLFYINRDTAKQTVAKIGEERIVHFLDLQRASKPDTLLYMSELRDVEKILSRLKYLEEDTSETSLTVHEHKFGRVCSHVIDSSNNDSCNDELVIGSKYLENRNASILSLNSSCCVSLCSDECPSTPCIHTSYVSARKHLYRHYNRLLHLKEIRKDTLARIKQLAVNLLILDTLDNNTSVDEDLECDVQDSKRHLDFVCFSMDKEKGIVFDRVIGNSLRRNVVLCKKTRGLDDLSVDLERSYRERIRDVSKVKKQSNAEQEEGYVNYQGNNKEESFLDEEGNIQNRDGIMNNQEHIVDDHRANNEKNNVFYEEGLMHNEAEGLMHNEEEGLMHNEEEGLMHNEEEGLMHNEEEGLMHNEGESMLYKEGHTIKRNNSIDSRDNLLNKERHIIKGSNLRNKEKHIIKEDNVIDKDDMIDKDMIEEEDTFDNHTTNNEEGNTNINQMNSNEEGNTGDKRDLNDKIFHRILTMREVVLLLREIITIPPLTSFIIFTHGSNAMVKIKYMASSLGGDLVEDNVVKQGTLGITSVLAQLIKVYQNNENALANERIRIKSQINDWKYIINKEVKIYKTMNMFIAGSDVECLIGEGFVLRSDIKKLKSIIKFVNNKFGSCSYEIIKKYSCNNEIDDNKSVDIKIKECEYNCDEKDNDSINDESIDNNDESIDNNESIDSINDKPNNIKSKYIRTIPDYICKNDKGEIITKILSPSPVIKNNNTIYEIPSLSIIETPKYPPTHFALNKYTGSFQDICNVYGTPQFDEINPAIFYITTFPFMFGCMFGDLGHGIVLLIFALYMIINEKKLNFPKSVSMIFNGRYMMLLCALWSMFFGIIFSDFLSLGIHIFPSQFIEINGIIQKKDDYVYPIGVDPAWHESESNGPMFMNSLKMKLSVILGFFHMALGICISIVNSKRKKDRLGLYCVLIPQILGYMSFVGYLIFLIYYKWIFGIQNASIINILVNMFTSPFNVDDEIYRGQTHVQLMLLSIIIITVPWMFFTKPFYETMQHKRKKYHKKKNDDENSYEDKKEVLIDYNENINNENYDNNNNIDNREIPINKRNKKENLNNNINSNNSKQSSNKGSQESEESINGREHERKESFNNKTNEKSSSKGSQESEESINEGEHERKESINNKTNEKSSSKGSQESKESSSKGSQERKESLHENSIKNKNQNINSNENLKETTNKIRTKNDIILKSEEESGIDITEIWVHSLIETIEFTIGLISNTSSYLRLWAISLAHNQLTTVLHSMTIGQKNFILKISLFLPYIMFTVALLIGLEGLSSCLHALRLNWIEFNSKFFKGGGYMFEPLHFDLEDDDE